MERYPRMKRHFSKVGLFRMKRSQRMGRHLSTECQPGWKAATGRNVISAWNATAEKNYSSCRSGNYELTLTSRLNASLACNANSGWKAPPHYKTQIHDGMPSLDRTVPQDWRLQGNFRYLSTSVKRQTVRFHKSKRGLNKAQTENKFLTKVSDFKDYKLGCLIKGQGTRQQTTSLGTTDKHTALK